MILLDTNVVIYAFDSSSPYYEWARQTIAGAVAGEGAAINAVSLAELCVGDAAPETVADRVRRWGVVILDVPQSAADGCAEAYRRFGRRMKESGKPSPQMPLPDFFIGAHAMIMGWELVTADVARFRSYFPSVALRLPE